ncbi:hypothetical protein HKBW3S43_02075, partial [Candidatus Hakubella thermalkaliphila]
NEFADASNVTVVSTGGTLGPWESGLDKSGLYKSLPILADATVIQDTPDSLGVLVPVDVSAATEYVKLSFFRDH